MIVPLHLVPAQARAGMAWSESDLGGVELPDLGMPLLGPVSAAELETLQCLMQRQRLGLQPTRMLYDRLYAFERLAAAHASADPELRELALELFQRYQSAGEWIGLQVH